MAKPKAVDPVGQMLTLAARRHRARHGTMLSEIGLFPGQEQVLRALMERDGLTMGEIAETLSIRPPTASKMAARMGAQGLVERRGSAGDARLVTIHITADGQALAERIARIARKLEKQMLDGLDDKDQRRLRRLLKRVARNLSTAEAQDDAGTLAEDETLDAA
jgi:DNA-binding MarR family transcriptional regulator